MTTAGGVNWETVGVTVCVTTTIGGGGFVGTGAAGAAGGTTTVTVLAELVGAGFAGGGLVGCTTTGVSTFTGGATGVGAPSGPPVCAAADVADVT